MSEQKTIEQLQEELDKLKDKNSQLIAEKRKAQAEREEVAERLASVEKERDEVAGKYKHLTVDLPRMDLLEEVGMPGASELLWRELNHHYDVVRADDGQDYFHHKEGERLELEGKPVKFDKAGIHALYDTDTVKTIGRLIKGDGISGGGATGATARRLSSTNKPEAPKPQFGMR